ncbi:peptidyl-prolyl cis-trans isomerase B (cyclophilin B) [Kitasatospora sp. MAP12-15]|uniref:peptidylprolyl isomerase n=1 Tax=unclassified Kitasatospora TaxID=2633591 RepID=UPI002473EBD0|nr:peptidylprolyl isomerase [Kitasatospora sp. MAP12-44]MDH6114258.1 peptidyl-prolyl cis-trans isomerase B (cyclophilin B) [Kitasatospora sp. MAP12-44]
MVNSEQRRRQLAREKYERQQQSRVEAQAKARRRNTIIGASLAVVVLAAGGAWAGGAFKSTAKTDTANAAPSQPGSPAAAPVSVKGCTAPAAGAPNGKQWSAEPAMSVDTNAKYTATLDTSCGTVTLQLDPSTAPHTVNSFVYLAGQNFFDHVKCHRLTTQGIYVLQCGDPTGSGSGGPGYKFADENLTDKAVAGGIYPAGTVAMANSGPGTNGSQFFLVYKDSQLAPSYTPFGKITGGMDVLNNIAAGGVQGGGGDGAPNANVVFNKVTAVKG